MQVPPGLKVAQVRVQSGEVINLLQFVMADGTIKNGGYSNDVGQVQPSFDLGPDEHIVRIMTKQLAASLIGFKIITSKGRDSLWYGGDEWAFEEFVGSAENPIVGFERNEGRILKVQLLRELLESSNASFAAGGVMTSAGPLPASVDSYLQVINVVFLVCSLILKIHFTPGPLKFKDHRSHTAKWRLHRLASIHYC